LLSLRGPAEKHSKRRDGRCSGLGSNRASPEKKNTATIPPETVSGGLVQRSMTLPDFPAQINSHEMGSEYRCSDRALDLPDSHTLQIRGILFCNPSASFSRCASRTMGAHRSARNCHHHHHHHHHLPNRGICMSEGKQEIKGDFSLPQN
jgi:hypothetical protein